VFVECESQEPAAPAASDTVVAGATTTRPADECREQARSCFLLIKYEGASAVLRRERDIVVALGQLGENGIT
jgi:hypothetical protein